MNEYARVTVRLDETVVAGRNPRADSRQDTHEHIPGSVLRGALAAVWIQRHGTGITTTPEFTRIFEGEGGFGPLHCPASLPVPLSMRTHKYPHTNRCRQLWWDEARYETADFCPTADCASPLETGKGEPRGTVRTVDRTMNAMSPDGVTLDGGLYSQRALPDELRLTGWVHGDALRALYPDDTPVTELLLGSRRSLRGHATVEIDTETVPDPVECHGNEVILRLASPGVFVDEYGMPTDQPDREELSEVLGVRIQEITGSWPRWEETGGWHAASGLPKPVERVVSAGSTYRLRCEQPPTEQARRLLMTRGIGLRRREGFGGLYRIDPPVGIAELTSRIAPLTRSSRLLSLFRYRLDPLRNGTGDDTRFHNALRRDDIEEDIATAIRTLLDVEDPALYEQLLDFLDNLLENKR
ncbi:type III-B CRISPR module-associated Cmr3 family protein [Actinopolyspora halophila]|uniref:type III-B CRISPR module-associated Cmr3 family protein n=1 Tax=Actinopolyspora halophila TaxID=1850 RepID=UPI00035DB609|nr:type III-B CRISPR module-associated Cmr3 family protein [Actinopolyspora halophila]